MIYLNAFSSNYLSLLIFSDSN